MIEIDGSYGEGGGQVVRLSVALSALTQIPVKIKNIRYNRPNPGLRPQHVTSIKALEQLCTAKTKGVRVGSTIIEFYPEAMKGGTYSFDIGTAGSITLVLQACILPSLFANKKIKISLTGGTDVGWSPPWDYFQHVFLSLLKKMNLEIDATLIKRGYYPKGGGEVSVTINPHSQVHPFLPNEINRYHVRGVINISQLPSHISHRIEASAQDFLKKNNLSAEIHIEEYQSSSPGVGFVLWASNGTILGTDCLGEKGKPAEKIGEITATKLITELNSGATLDNNAVDQLLPYLLLAKKSSFLCRELSNHAQTEIWLLKKFFSKIFSVAKKDHLLKISIDDK